MDRKFIVCTQANQKKTKKTESNSEEGNGNKNRKGVWKNFSNIFTKPDNPDKKERRYSLRRFGSLFRNQKNADLLDEVLKPASLTTIILPTEEITTVPSDEAMEVPGKSEDQLAIALKLPIGMASDNYAITIELEAISKGTETDELNERPELQTIECLSETESKSVFVGNIKVPSNTDLGKLVNMPLYLVDSKEKLLTNPGIRVCPHLLMAQTKENLLPDITEKTLIGDLRLVVELNRIETKMSQENEIRSIDYCCMGSERILKKITDSLEPVEEDYAVPAVNSAMKPSNSKTLSCSFIKTPSVGQLLPACCRDITDNEDKSADSTDKVGCRKRQRCQLYGNLSEKVSPCEELVQWLSPSYLMPKEESVHHDVSTQYSTIFSQANKAVEVQSSFMFSKRPRYEDDRSSSDGHSLGRECQETSKRHRALIIPNFHKRISMGSVSFASNDSAWPKSSATSRRESNSTFNSAPSGQSSHYTYGLVVPSNSPKVHVVEEDYAEYYPEVRSSRKTMDARIDLRDLEHLELPHPPTKWSPVVCMRKHEAYGVHTTRMPFITKGSKTTDDQLELLSLGSSSEYPYAKRGSRKAAVEEDEMELDRTLELLECARAKLVTYLSRGSNVYDINMIRKISAMKDSDVPDVCGLMPRESSEFSTIGTITEADNEAFLGRVDVNYASCWNNDNVSTSHGSKTYDLSSRRYGTRFFAEDECYESQHPLLDEFINPTEVYRANKNFNIFTDPGFRDDILTNLNENLIDLYPYTVNSVYVNYVNIDNNPLNTNKKENSPPTPPVNDLDLLSFSDDGGARSDNSLNRDTLASQESLNFAEPTPKTSSVDVGADETDSPDGTIPAKVKSCLELYSRKNDKEEELIEQIESLDNSLTKINELLQSKSSSLQESMKMIEVLAEEAQEITIRYKPTDEPNLCANCNYLIVEDPSEERNRTFTVVENDIKVMIRELLIGSESIKELAILNGVDEVKEPPLIFDFLEKAIGTPKQKENEISAETVAKEVMEVLLENVATKQSPKKLKDLAEDAVKINRKVDVIGDSSDQAETNKRIAKSQVINTRQVYFCTTNVIKTAEMSGSDFFSKNRWLFLGKNKVRSSEKILRDLNNCYWLCNELCQYDLSTNAKKSLTAKEKIQTIKEILAETLESQKATSEDALAKANPAETNLKESVAEKPFVKDESFIEPITPKNNFGNDTPELNDSDKTTESQEKKSETATATANAGMQKSAKSTQLNNPKPQESDAAKREKKIIATSDEEEFLQEHDLCANSLQSPASDHNEAITSQKSTLTATSKATSHTRSAVTFLCSSSSEEELVSIKPRFHRSRSRQRPETEGAVSNMPHVNSSVSVESSKSNDVSVSFRDSDDSASNLFNPRRKCDEEDFVRNVRDSGYDADQDEDIKIKVPNMKPKCRSVPEINSSKEIAKIDKNVKDNNRLERQGLLVLLPSGSSGSMGFDCSEESVEDIPERSLEDSEEEILSSSPNDNKPENTKLETNPVYKDK